MRDIKIRVSGGEMSVFVAAPEKGARLSNL